MNETSRNVIVGITTVGGIVGLVVMLLMFGWLPSALQTGYQVTIHLPTSGGLAPESSITLNDIPIGRVQSVELGPQAQGVVLIGLINDEQRIPNGAKVSVPQTLFGSASSLAFDTTGFKSLDDLKLEAKYREDVLVLERADETAADADRFQQARDNLEGLTFTGYLKTDGSEVVFGEAGGMFETLKDGLAGPLANLETISDSFSKLSSEWTRVGENIRALTNLAPTEDVDAGNTFATLSTVLERADQRLKALQEIFDGVQAYTDDEVFMADVKTTASNARSLTDKANTLANKAESTLTGVDSSIEDLKASVKTSIDKLAASYVSVADDISQTIKSIDGMVESARQGDGTVARVLNNPQLYDNMNDAAMRLQKAIDEVTLVAQKWKAEGLPVQLFD